MNILFTSIGRRTYLIRYFKEILQGKGEVHAANSHFVYAMQHADSHVITPLISDSAYIPFLIDYCIQHHINAIVPVFDIDLATLAKNKPEIEKHGILVLTSDYETIRVCNDKWLTYLFLKNNNIETPLSFLSLDECLNAIDKRELGFPLIIKPRWGMGSIGIIEANDENELDILYKKSLKEIEISYLRTQSDISEENPIIIQEKITGEERCIDNLNDLKGSFLYGVPMVIESMRAGESDVVCVIKDTFLQQIAREISSKMKIIGNWNIDALRMNEKYYVVDINCRISGLYPFSYLSGANYPEALVKLLQGEVVPEGLLNSKEGLRAYKDINPVVLER